MAKLKRRVDISISDSTQAYRVIRYLDLPSVTKAVLARQILDAADGEATFYLLRTNGLDGLPRSGELKRRASELVANSEKRESTFWLLRLKNPSARKKAIARIAQNSKWARDALDTHHEHLTDKEKRILLDAVLVNAKTIYARTLLARNSRGAFTLTPKQRFQAVIIVAEGKYMPGYNAQELLWNRSSSYFSTTPMTAQERKILLSALKQSPNRLYHLLMSDDVEDKPADRFLCLLSDDEIRDLLGTVVSFVCRAMHGKNPNTKPAHAFLARPDLTKYLSEAQDREIRSWLGRVEQKQAA